VEFLCLVVPALRICSNLGESVTDYLADGLVVTGHGLDSVDVKRWKVSGG
jgi:hypothetical protein